MKTSIINALIVAFIAGIEVAEACASYQNCRCSNADPNSVDADINTITAAACAQYHTAAGLDGTSRASAYTTWIDGNGVTWCQGGSGADGELILPVDNCDMHTYCNSHGAAGADSICADKQ
ncbi:hypothetical protein LZ32DRAFT_683530 [Colletotrichum eremochloae]|nr:hypothetical protein LZ32DRAFT_683530 [Colletotrichum eremochloae]